MKKATKVPLGERVGRLLIDGQTDLLKKFNGSKSNVGYFLAEIFFWQEIQDTANDKLKQAWQNAQADTGPIDTDDDLRDLGKGKHIVCESERFSCVADVQDPRLNFDRTLFINAVCKAYNLDRVAIDKLADACRVQTKAPLSKRILEVS